MTPSELLQICLPRQVEVLTSSLAPENEHWRKRRQVDERFWALLLEEQAFATLLELLPSLHLKESLETHPWTVVVLIEVLGPGTAMRTERRASVQPLLQKNHWRPMYSSALRSLLSSRMWLLWMADQTLELFSLGLLLDLWSYASTPGHCLMRLGSILVRPTTLGNCCCFGMLALLAVLGFRYETEGQRVQDSIVQQFCYFLAPWLCLKEPAQH